MEFEPRNPYGPPSQAIAPTDAYIAQLRSMTHNRGLLVKNGFVINPLSESDIDDKKRCQRCNARCVNKKSRRKAEDQKNLLKKSDATQQNTKENENGQEKPSPKPVLKCQYHTGRSIQMHWTCCSGFVSAPGCTFAPEHLTRVYTAQELRTRYQFHETPPLALVDLSPEAPAPLISVGSFSPPVHASFSARPRRPRRAVAVDCEMGVAFDGESELIRLTVVDYFTSEILLDSLVFPAVQMAHYNTRYSGVSRKDMDDARRKGTCIIGGPAAAREAMWEWIGPQTVVVGHGVNNDFASLRWIHPLIVDSLILALTAKAEKEKLEREEEEERKKAAAAAAATTLQQSGDLISFSDPHVSSQEAAGGGGMSEKEPAKKKKGGGLSLKHLTRDLLGREIQVGKRGHDSHEDAIASRDLVHWYVMQKFAEIQAQNEYAARMGFW